MEIIIKLIKSYLALRSVVLRGLEDKRFSKKALVKIANITDSQYQSRSRDPNKWTIAEISSIAKALNLNPKPCYQIDELAGRLDCLTVQVKISLFQLAQLDAKRLLLRQKNYNRWQANELRRLLAALEAQKE